MPNLITFSGNRAGTSDAEGADNCIAFLNRVKAQAEDKGGTICMEYLNSKVNHKDYMFDHFACAVDNEDAGHPAPGFGADVQGLLHARTGNSDADAVQISDDGGQ